MSAVDRQVMDVDIVCVGFGPAMGGFLTTLSQGLRENNGYGPVESRVMPGMPPMVICYERADDVGFGVSGVVTRARAIRETLPELDPAQIPMAAEIKREKLVYLLDPLGASRRPWTLRSADRLLRLAGRVFGVRHAALELPFIPPFLHKTGGLILSIGQFNQWIAGHLMSDGVVQVWPGMPVSVPILDEQRVAGVRLADQGVDKQGQPASGYMPGMDIQAALTVIGDGPVGAVGRTLEEKLGLPPEKEKRDWAVGMKMVIELAEGVELDPGTVIHTFGFPEPEIFGFLYVMPNRLVSAGVFVPSWFDSPVRTTYRYLQHWLQHPYLWRWLKGGKLRSWGAKTLQESGWQGEPWLAGDGWARIGEGSGSTNVLTGSGVDEAWKTGTLLGEGVLELLREGREFSKENLERAYVERRRASWLESEARVAEHARDGFGRGFLWGMMGMGLAGLTGGKFWIPGTKSNSPKSAQTPEEYFKGRIAPEDIDAMRRQHRARGGSLHDALLEKAGWPAIEYDGRLLMSHQDALMVGGKVQAPAGYADHVTFLYPHLCEQCGTQLCVEICSGQALTLNPDGGIPIFDREKCVHCGACLWNCNRSTGHAGVTNLRFGAGAGGLHSADN